MEFLIITGLSGAGKTRAADVLEDLDYYCVDNMPVALIPRFAELCLDTRGRYEKVALVTDTRDREGFGKLLDTIEDLRKLDDCTVRILYMDADTPTLIRRYKESRRPHPLAEKGMTTEEAVQKEEELLSAVRRKADYVVNSSSMTLGMLQNRLFSLFSGEERKRSIDVTVMSFGFKHGIPLEADLVFDARFLPNPFYVEELRAMTGMDAPVREYVLSSDTAQDFLDRLCGMIDFLLPQYAEEGRYGLTIAVGCTGGQHRSVTIANALAERLAGGDYGLNIIHRDAKH